MFTVEVRSYIDGTIAQLTCQNAKDFLTKITGETSLDNLEYNSDPALILDSRDDTDKTICAGDVVESWNGGPEFNNVTYNEARLESFGIYTLQDLILHTANQILTIPEKLGKDYRDIILVDDSGDIGGISHENETLGEFMDTVDLTAEDSYADLKLAMVDCGVALPGTQMFDPELDI